MFFVMATIPMVFVGWFGFEAASRAAATRSMAHTTVRDVSSYVGALQVRSMLLAERNWSLVVLGIVDLGVSADVVVVSTGIDPTARLGQVRQRVDVRVDAILPEIQDDLADLRAGTDISTVGSGYLSLVDRLSDPARRLDALLVDAAELASAGDLTATLQVLDHASDASRVVSSQLTNAFAALFGQVPPGTAATEELVTLRAGYAEARTSLDELLLPGSNAALQAESVAASGDVAQFVAMIDAYIERIGDPTSADLSMMSLFADVDEIVAAFLAGEAAEAAHLDLVDAAAADAIDASNRIAGQADRDLRTVGVLVALAAVTLIGSLAVVGRLIVVPLGRLERRARALTEGLRTSDPQHPVLRELRAVSAALDDAGEQLGLVERQALALAAGDLDDPALATAVHTPLGTSLQTAVRSLAESINERDRLRRELAHEASHDALTGLPNRTAALTHLRARLDATRPTGGVLAVMFVDLDRFKNINDEHGHLVGDKVLQVVATRLANGTRQQDLVARIGGDEFLVIAEGLGSPDEGTDVAERLRAAVSVPINVGDVWSAIEVSVGVAVTTPGVHVSYTDLLHTADLAMYQAKEHGRGRVHPCTHHLQPELDDVDVAVTSHKEAASA